MANNALIPGLVSIIVPVYNSERHLAPCIESALAQSGADIELLLIDDGSTDESGSICDAYASRDNRIRVEHLSNGGPAAARNRGIALSKGEFLFFLDSDDRIENDAIRSLVENQQLTQADMVIGDFGIIRSGVRGSGSTFLFPESTVLDRGDVVDQTIKYLKKPTAYAPLTFVWGKLFRASILKGEKVLFKPEQRIFEDLDLNIRYLQHADVVSYVKNRIYLYTGYPNSGATAAGIHSDPLAYKSALNTIQMFLCGSGVPAAALRRYVGNAHVYFAIRIMVAAFRYDKRLSIWSMRSLISTIVKDRDVRSNLGYYSPASGDSKTIPALIRLKLTAIIMAVCLYKARRRPVVVVRHAA